MIRTSRVPDETASQDWQFPTKHRLPTLMHDPLYRLSVAWQNAGYDQPVHPGFCLKKAATEDHGSTGNP